MSRIYEALQKAELERSDTPPGQRENEDGETVSPTEMAEPLDGRCLVDVESVRRLPWKPSIASLPALAERGECVEQFRSLRSHLYLLRVQGDLKTILISSGMPGEGKTFVAANLAVSLARNNEGRVLLIDADLRRSTLHKLLGAPVSPGLADYLAGTSSLTEIMQLPCNSGDSDRHVRDISNVTFIPAGECQESSLELVANRRIEELIAKLSPHFDWIVMDAPPVLAVTDAVDLARAADGVLLVAREAQTPYDVAQRALAAYSNSRVLGFVLNAVKNPPPSSHYYHHYYGGQEPADASRRHAKRKARE
jgi:capsular exopolysaccharide synthesis family protein